MIKYVVTCTENGEKWVCGRYDTLEAAQKHLEGVRFYPPNCRFESCLHLDDDGMSGSGQDEDGAFDYNIEEEEVA